METFTFTFDGAPIGATLHRADGGKGTILYYHGGGLIYGSRDDLPRPYVETITRRGYHLLCLDYLLAPESPLDRIHASVDRGLEWFLSARREELGLGDTPWVLFGRSAGAYLALTLAGRRARAGEEGPAALWAFYGYYTLNHPLLSGVSSHYRQLPALDAALIPNLRGKPPISEAPMDSRFYLYVYGRQQGRWTTLLGAGEEELKEYSLDREGLAQLPPTFLTASTADQDVPFSCSREMSLAIPHARFLPVYGLEHDYDRDPSLPESRETYQAALDWLDGEVAS